MSSRKGKFVGIYFESLIEGEDCYERGKGMARGDFIYFIDFLVDFSRFLRLKI